MAPKKTPKRTFESELRSLPVELIPPDPSGVKLAEKPQTALPGQIIPLDAETERGLVGKLIARIKKL